MIERLKSLELQGFKTFANRTVFEFANTITAIVGPNGSGKSNIADSLRWVLGEQSYSLLRAKKTEDMIFSGSENRPRAGLAAVTVTFDNSDGWLPIDFSEVAITRRAYRDGQNAYLINGQRVRLRDVTELLAQSGLSERTYTVIGQGLVDAALSLKAEERRRLFEEAAGIGLHRSRREKALRRLDKTRRNLERVQDILAELKPRLRSLERQARRAQGYEQVKTDLQELLREYYGFHWHRAQQELTDARKAVDFQETKLGQARHGQKNLDSTLGGLRQRTQDLRNELSAWHRDSAHLHTQREGISRRLAVAEERQRSLKDQEQNTELELLNRQEEANLYKDQLSQLGQEAEGKRNDLNEAAAQSKGAKDALDQRQAERKEAEAELIQEQNGLAALNARQGKLQALAAEHKGQIERITRAMISAEETIAAVDLAYKEAESNFAATQKAETGAAQDVKTAADELAAAREELERLEVLRRSSLEMRSEITARLAGYEAQMDVLDQAENSLTGYAEGTRMLLEAAR